MYTTRADRDLLDLCIDELRGEPVLNAQQQKELARQMRRAKNDDERDAARSELIRANLRFAFSVAKQYQNRGVPLADLVSEANAGLVRAADQRQSRTVQVPLNRAADLSRVSRAQELLRQGLSREPYEEEIATVADLSLDVTRGLVALLQPTRSLDEPAISGEPGRTLGETLVLDRGEDEDVL